MLVEPFSLEAALNAIESRITPEMREEDERFQMELRASVGGMIDPNSAQMRITRARQQETALLEEIARVSQAEESQLKQNRLYSLLNRLSEVLAEQGKYADAVEVCPEQQRREYYRQILDAINLPDSETCNCEGERFVGKNRQTVDVRTETPVLEIVTPGGSVKRLSVCRKCGFANVR